MKENEIKKNLRETISNCISSVSGVISLTFVGSFVDKEGLTGISDIDTIVICNELNEDIFKKCLFKVQNLSLEKCGLEGYRLKINYSLGPLKFDEPDLVVIHLMFYDVESHRTHVLSSPFTCFDWERSKIFFGKPIKEIFPVGCLQPRDFLEARRGLDNYLDDISNGSISIRNYDFKRESVSEIQQNHPLDKRHRGEYAYHIVRNIVLNGLKLKNNENRIYSENELEKGIGILLGGDTLKHENNFRQLSQLKKMRSMSFPKWTIEWARSFVKDFQKAFIPYWQSAKTVYFIRHAMTSLNDGTFLGQRRNPGIINRKISLPYEV